MAIHKRLSGMDVPFVVNDMGTLIEGEASDLLKIIMSVYETPFEQGAVRVVTQISIDDRRDKDVKIGDKIQSVTRRTMSTDVPDHE